jgi:hypothetical protein
MRTGAQVATLTMTALLLSSLAPFGASARRPAVAASASKDDRKYVRACDDSVYGGLGKGWRKRSVVVGPIAFVGGRDYKDSPREDFRKRNGGYRYHKILAVVENGRDVIVRVPRHRRDRLALFYDPALFNRERVPLAKADYQVRFDACRNKDENPFGKGRAQFNGGFVVARAQCSVLNIVKRGKGRIGRAHFSFGMGRCPKD